MGEKNEDERPYVLTEVVADIDNYLNYLGLEVASACKALGVPVPLTFQEWFERHGSASKTSPFRK